MLLFLVPEVIVDLVGGNAIKPRRKGDSIAAPVLPQILQSLEKTSEVISCAVSMLVVLFRT